MKLIKGRILLIIFQILSKQLLLGGKTNIKTWLNNLTNFFSDKSIEQLKKLEPLKDKWRICHDQCTYCSLKCSKVSPHLNEHNCGFNHICEEKCQICIKSKIKIKYSKYEKCDYLCVQKSGHKGLHKCSKKCCLNELRKC